MRNLKFIFLFLAVSVLGSCSTGRQKSALTPLSYYMVNEISFDGAQFVNTPDFPKLGYLRPVPDLVIDRLKTAGIYKLHAISDVEGTGEHTESWGRAVVFTLFVADAERVAELKRQNIGKHDLVWMLGGAPLGTTYLSDSADSPDSVPIPKGPSTNVIPLREHQNVRKIEHDLKSLVRH
jgi:hypothetical protein